MKSLILLLVLLGCTGFDESSLECPLGTKYKIGEKVNILDNSYIGCSGYIREPIPYYRYRSSSKCFIKYSIQITECNGTKMDSLILYIDEIHTEKQ